MQGRLTVFFEGQFWVGVFEREEDGQLQALRMVFGPEPREEELYAWILQAYPHLRFGVPSAAEDPPKTRVNPKRRQREVHREMQRSGVSTKAQDAIRQSYEASKRERTLEHRERRRAEKQRHFDLKQQKKKEKHRGH